MATVSTPNNLVLFGGINGARKSRKVKTVTGIRRKLLVKYDTDDLHVQLAGAGEIHGLDGWLEDVFPANGRTWENDADPTAEDGCTVVSGVGANVCGILATGQNVKRGDLLVSAANGRVAKAATLAIPAGGTTVTSTSANPALTGSAPPDGRIVGMALHDVDATSAEKDIGIASHI